jgi:pyrroline-5-carboxylate reductase
VSAVTVGLVGAGNMARALARGWGDPVLCTDAGSGRAAALAAEVGGEVVRSNRELAERAEVVVLCHKPAALPVVAAELDRRAQVVVSLLAATGLGVLQAALPQATVFRAMPNLAVEVRQGVTCWCAPDGADPEVVGRVRELFERVGRVESLPEALMDVATGTVGVSPAYVSLIAEAQIDAAVKQGLPSPRATDIVVDAIAGAAALLRARGGDTLAVRREVTSPGGSTARGLAVLERAGIRVAFVDALEAVLGERAR